MTAYRTDLCAYDNHDAPATFVVENREHDKWGLCDSHLTPGLVIMAGKGPLNVEPIFSNWKPTERRSDVDV